MWKEASKPGTTTLILHFLCIDIVKAVYLVAFAASFALSWALKTGPEGILSLLFYSKSSFIAEYSPAAGWCLRVVIRR